MSNTNANYMIFNNILYIFNRLVIVKFIKTKGYLKKKQRLILIYMKLYKYLYI